MCVDAEESQCCDMLTAESREERERGGGQRERGEEIALGRSQDRHNTAFLFLLPLKVFSEASLR